MIANVKMVTVQNRIALDLVLAPEGGTCPLVGFECCTYRSDKLKYIEEEEEGANFHNYCTDDGIFLVKRKDF